MMRWPLPPPVRERALRAFASAFGIGVAEAEQDLHAYASLDQFFTRRLKPGLRPVEAEFIHPVDGRLTESGVIASGELIQAKGWTYPLAEFLGDTPLATHFEGGHYYTYYLCPADYHRVHAPAPGELVSGKHIPGLLWPVNEWSVNNIRRLFCLNERVVLNFTSPAGRWSLVMVGATNVGHITVTLDPSITTNRWMWHAPSDRQYTPPLPVRAGDEVGIFHLGSTVVCLFDRNFTRAQTGARAVRMGQCLGPPDKPLLR
ncbi:MAG: archaetidylserine decarboxylase [Bdellovibrionales bacterium]